MTQKSKRIYLRKDGRWEARFFKEIDPNGRKKYGSVYGNSYQEVKDKLQACLPWEEINKRCNFTPTISDLSRCWLLFTSTQVKPSTYQKYLGLSQNHILPHLGEYPLNTITRAQVETFAKSQQNNGKIGGGTLSIKTVNDILIILNLMFRFAEEEYEVSMPKVYLLRTERQEMRVLSTAEQKILTAYLLQEMDLYKFGVLLALYTGLRIGELCALEWNDITGDCLRISKTVQRLKGEGGKTQLLVGAPKSDSSRRIVPLPAFLLPYIEQFRRPCGRVIQTRNQTAAEPRILQYHFRKMTDACGLEPLGFHTLRHSFATRCVEVGFDTKTLSEILGHADVKTTLNRYVHSSFMLKQQNMAKLSLQLDI